MFEKIGRFHRVPVGFGPAPSPRRGPDGKPFPNWGSDLEMHLTEVVYDVGRAELQSILPQGYEVDPDQDQPTVFFEIMNLRKLPWLAGRGYNTWGIYANDVVCRRVDPPVKVSYMLVLFESFTDPITNGREDLGFCKVWAELPDPVIQYDKLVHTAAWFGTEFLRLEIPGFAFGKPEDSPAFRKRPNTMPSVEGTLHHRYVPAVGEPDKHDTSYATFMPGECSAKPNILNFATTTLPTAQTKLIITQHPWQALPTL